VILKLTLEYDGTGFRGWARQPGERTVEESVRTALGAVYPSWQGLAVAGRTDTGVHATGQVASVEVEGGPPAGRAAEALNTVLPPDVAVIAAEDAPDGFHARFSARARTYRYVVLNRRERSALDARRSLWWPRAVDDEQLARSAAALRGEHDFRAFTPTETQHQAFRREIAEAAWRRHDDQLHFTITADSFLRHMVRTLVGTMLERPAEAVSLLLAGGARSDAGPTAPPWGLYLVHVDY
jgi:tRNA pseudouridine38-40 synthase